mmetsp:Transcript_3761/g.9404  ORF Transcript_3761/g.9404 Transcript_3761/m.9404 type:complete len:203 (+) Transcript_3761:450-1058(+)
MARLARAQAAAARPSPSACSCWPSPWAAGWPPLPQPEAAAGGPASGQRLRGDQPSACRVARAAAGAAQPGHHQPRQPEPAAVCRLTAGAAVTAVTSSSTHLTASGGSAPARLTRHGCDSAPATPCTTAAAPASLPALLIAHVHLALGPAACPPACVSALALAQGQGARRVRPTGQDTVVRLVTHPHPQPQQRCWRRRAAQGR